MPAAVQNMLTLQGNEMKTIEHRLQADAARIRVQTPAAVKQRMHRALARAGRQEPAPRRASWLTPGFATAVAMSFVLAVVALVWLKQPEESAPAVPVIASGAPLDNHQDPMARITQVMAARESPEAELQAELAHLNADWQRIRTRVRDQLDPLL